MTWAGETDGKRVARYCLGHLLMSIPGFPAPGKAIIIAGDGGDCGVASRVLALAARDVYLVDVNGECVRRAWLAYPGYAHECPGDVRCFLDGECRDGEVSFAWLDLMSNFSVPGRRLLYQIATRLHGRMRPGGVVVFTYLRGRESADDVIALRAEVELRLARMLAAAIYARIDYWSSQSPMRMLVLRASTGHLGLGQPRYMRCHGSDVKRMLNEATARYGYRAARKILNLSPPASPEHPGMVAYRREQQALIGQA